MSTLMSASLSLVEAGVAEFSRGCADRISSTPSRPRVFGTSQPSAHPSSGRRAGDPWLLIAPRTLCRWP